MAATFLATLRSKIEADLRGRVASPFSYRDCNTFELVSTGIPEMNALLGGLPRGAMTEICGAACSGRTSFLLSALASPTKTVRQVPLNAWFRFRRAVEDTPTILLLLEQEPNAKTCASLVLRLEAGEAQWAEAAPPVAEPLLPVPVATSRFSRTLPGYPFARLLRGFAVSGDTVRSRIQIPEQRVINIRAGAHQKMAPPHKTDREMFETETIWKTR